MFNKITKILLSVFCGFFAGSVFSVFGVGLFGSSNTNFSFEDFWLIMVVIFAIVFYIEFEINEINEEENEPKQDT